MKVDPVEFALSRLTDAELAAIWCLTSPVMPLTLYPFRYRDPRTGHWVKAHYQAQLEVIKQRYAEYEITGPPEIREGARPGHVQPAPPPRQGAVQYIG